MRNPINLQIQNAQRYWTIVEVTPLLIEKGNKLISTGTYELYKGYPEHDSDLYNAEALLERYLAALELSGEDHPGFLGALHFKGIDFFEWKYEGTQLTEFEVLQIVDCIQNYTSVHSLDFKFGRDQVVYQIRIEEMEGHYAVFVDDVFTAQVELMEEDWEITSGDIYDPDLRDEVLKRINANSA